MITKIYKKFQYKNAEIFYQILSNEKETFYSATGAVYFYTNSAIFITSVLSDESSFEKANYCFKITAQRFIDNSPLKREKNE